MASLPSLEDFVRFFTGAITDTSSSACITLVGVNVLFLHERTDVDMLHSVFQSSSGITGESHGGLFSRSLSGETDSLLHSKTFLTSFKHLAQSFFLEWEKTATRSYKNPWNLMIFYNAPWFSSCVSKIDHNTQFVFFRRKYNKYKNGEHKLFWYHTERAV